MELKPRQVITLTLWYWFDNLQMHEFLHTPVTMKIKTDQSLLKDRYIEKKKQKNKKTKQTKSSIFEG